MTEPLRTDVPPEADREARIEQLLLAGLDEYFAGRYEQAINVWTRVIFLERGHSRARAYIERARGALAERHRESEELLHRGMAALDDGRPDAARDLITQAVEQGGPQDMALVLLDRLNRLKSPPGAVETPRTARHERRARPAGETAPRRWVSWWLGAASALAAGAVALAVAVLSGLPVPGWLYEPAPPEPRAAALPADPLPLARSSERAIARARSLQSGGHLYDALQVLDGVSLADPLRAEADRLRGELQRQLLEAAR